MVRDGIDPFDHLEEAREGATVTSISGSDVQVTAFSYAPLNVLGVHEKSGDALLMFRQMAQRQPEAFKVWRNDITGVAMWEADGRPSFCPSSGSTVTDDDVDAIAFHFVSRFKMAASPVAAVREAIEEAAKNSLRSTPQRNWLLTLPEWDGVERLGEMVVSGLGATKHVEALREMTPKIFARAYGRGVALGDEVVQLHECLVLCGPHGARKDTSIRALIPPELRLELIGAIGGTIGDDDSKRTARQRFLVNIPELSGLNKSTVNTVKDFMGSDTDGLIEKYKSTYQETPRRCFFMGSTNDDKWLNDSTGNRRWIPVHLQACCPEWIEEHREQLWAEAAHLWNTKRSELWIAAEDIQRISRDVNAAIAGEFSEWLQDMAEDSPGEFVSTAALIEKGRELNGPRFNASHATRMMRAAGWIPKKSKVAGKSVRGWVYVTEFEEKYTSATGPGKSEA